MEDEKLMECVRKYEFIYNLQHPKYMDTVRKEMAWKDISEQLKQSGKYEFSFIFSQKPSPLDLEQFGRNPRIDHVLQKRKKLHCPLGVAGY